MIPLVYGVGINGEQYENIPDYEEQFKGGEKIMDRTLLKNWYNSCKRRDSLTDTDIALKCGVSRNALGDIINGDSIPSFYTGVRLANYLSITCEHLMNLLLSYGERSK